MTSEPNDIFPEDQQWLAARMESLTFAETLASFRQCEGWFQTETAKRANMSLQMYNAYERGRRLPSVRLAYEMGEALGMSGELAIVLVMNDQLRREKLPMRISKVS